MKVIFFADSQCVEDLACVPVGCGPVEAPTFLDDLVKSAADLLKRSEIVIKMSVDHIYIVQLQPVETSLHSFADVLPAYD